MEKRKIDIPQRLTQNMLTPQEECLEIPQKKAKLFIGIPKERSFQENRVALSPAAVKTLVNAGHKIVVEEDAGLEAGFLDFEYSEAGAEIAYSSEQVFKAHVIIKVAPPSLQEIDLCHPGQIIISPIHLPSLSEEYIYRLKKKRVTALAMEYMKDQSGIFPFVHSMSEMAGISAMQTAAELLSKSGNGLGILLGGIPGIPPAKVVVLGAGVVAEVATRVALGYGAEVRVFDNNIRKLMRLQGNLRQKIYTGTFNSPELEVELRDAEVVIGAIHSEIGRTPIIVSDSMVKNMKSGSVIIDVSIDQGGCFATSRMTTHDKPTFIEYDVIHYCVPNIVARIPQTSSKAISNILIPFFLEAGGTQGIEALLHSSPGFRNGVYMYKGCLTNKYLSDFFNVKYTDLNLLLASNL
ncbi:alanine dehydrogenase [Aureispira sp. CCB-E]|uniref:alanine dehydrogenase n=1 Tax=Aureispira sp. CCB-E TaxID=3051121 RepID=UPI0028690512|nr:alanine dehydrogenase [Aureispira sp. CCB-E]WMX16710.1 alanine dehydrogenase [Aureispira sp. CCB-E]